MTVFGGKSGKNAPNMAFFGALRANRSTFCSFTAKVLKIKWVLKFMWLLLLPVRSSFGQKNRWVFWAVEFFPKCYKKACLKSNSSWYEVHNTNAIAVLTYFDHSPMCIWSWPLVLTSGEVQLFHGRRSTPVSAPQAYPESIGRQLQEDLLNDTTLGDTARPM